MAHHNKNASEALELLNSAGGKIPSKPSSYAESVKVNLGSVITEGGKNERPWKKRKKRRSVRNKKESDLTETEVMSVSESEDEVEAPSVASSSISAVLAEDATDEYKEATIRDIIASTLDAINVVGGIKVNTKREELLKKLREKVQELKSADFNTQGVAYKAMLAYVDLAEQPLSEDFDINNLWILVGDRLNKNQNLQFWFRILQ